ncbi:hypothetical protein H2198_001449 [Neophaeococcomyces mojaviensis]|uniref:Uncharacterized protein n=1 Tax=Neophaeococcomyces mojaviensis TaxID=3383035 RepID=A0ACC3AHH0_9EURO|nr:hypothetical protein H2198_001449 [Knufia sp. JES_112]
METNESNAEFELQEGFSSPDMQLFLSQPFDPDLLFDFDFPDLTYDTTINPSTTQEPPTPYTAFVETADPPTQLEPPKPKRAPAANRRWCPSYLRKLMHSRRPSNLPESVEYTDTTEVQSIPTELLVPAFTTVTSCGADGQVVEMSVGSRVRHDDSGNGVVPEETLFMLSVVDANGMKVYDMVWSKNLNNDLNESC